MKSLFSEEYYREHWDKFMKPTVGENYMNLEAELEREMRCYYEVNLPTEALKKIEKMKAEEIAERCRKVVLEDKNLVLKIIAKTANFGYTTQRQESQAHYRFRTRFDFNCLQLSDFRKKYGV